ncbi:MAG: hypothetical protein NZ699_13105 [Roseiflexus sp.]|nr:hypothetical protein [Roseiflexus sp.]MCS7290063.1 hypothetical protein [Roseiflexus sp.]MDW8148502.1 hypothetical protein [Roseiflexaceae bacterium]MDW8232166.1 hypothetical protein [Roseiflexaceae bacterium]
MVIAAGIIFDFGFYAGRHRFVAPLEPVARQSITAFEVGDRWHGHRSLHHLPPSFSHSCR